VGRRLAGAPRAGRQARGHRGSPPPVSATTQQPETMGHDRAGGRHPDGGTGPIRWRAPSREGAVAGERSSDGRDHGKEREGAGAGAATGSIPGHRQAGPASARGKRWLADRAGQRRQAGGGAAVAARIAVTARSNDIAGVPARR
jgi:hypothetical protein